MSENISKVAFAERQNLISDIFEFCIMAKAHLRCNDHSDTKIPLHESILN